ncbi:MAG: type III-A CRISPR-associated protein Cas10/Csm1 [candidate division WOR-3 bacterium]|nr:type III-A CRISPR-associated protein Cas10/Csm1 [candidate division WOR-3 bacterium]
MYNQEEYQSLILAALLHDIGKFYQRTGVELREEDKKIMTSCCPVYKDKYSHQHVLYSGRFVREIFNNRLQTVENIVLYHHRPDSAIKNYSRLAKIIALADRLSSGERREEDSVSEREVSKEPLISIFSTLFSSEQNIRYQYIPLLPLSCDLTPLFPEENKSKAIKDNSYSSLWNAFVSEMQHLKDESDLNSIITKVLFLLQKFTFFVPSAAYVDRPDISLYHHLKTTAAIASCLYLLNIKEDEIDNLLSAIKDEKYDNLQGTACLLLACDVSGIQDFIYSITSEYALKSIKGRSFYLQLISECVARSILKLLNLPLCNIIFIGGGNFYLLLPDTENAKKEIENYNKLLSNNFLFAHRGKLALNIAYEEVKYSDFLGKNFGNKWSLLKRSLAIEKKRKFSTLLADSTTKNILLGPFDMGGEQKVCQVCGEELEDDGDICSLCNSFAELAYDLPRARYLQEIFLNPKELREPVKVWSKLLESLGMRNLLLRDAIPGEKIYLINNLDFINGKLKFNGFYLIAQNAPRSGEQIKTLEEIANDSDGVKKWGVFRADVDNLGKTFAEGLGGEDRTISRIAMLSEMLGMFFNIQVEKIAREPEFQEKIYIIYSGGDDLFIIGAWSVLPDFAMRLYQDFRKYTAQNLTLSGAIYIAPTKKFPVYQAANQAKDDLELAKRGDKNKLTFLGIPIPWNVMQDLKEIKDRIIYLLDENGPKLPRALLQILNFGWVETQKFKKGEVPMQRIWRFLYAMKRLKERSKEEYIKDIDALEKEVLIETKKEFRDYLEVPVRWAELLTRKEE